MADVVASEAQVTDAAQARSRTGLSGVVARYRLVAFGGLVVALTALVMVANLGRETTPFGLVFVPAVAAIVVAALSDGRAGVARLFARITRWRVAPRWYALAIGVPVAATLLIVLLGVVTGASPNTEATGVAFIVPLVVLLPGLIEEFGWRGYGVPAAPSAWPTIVVALVIGGLFLIPHLPLYLPGQLYEDLALWPIPLTILGGSVAFTWILVGTGGSSLLAGLSHAASNGATPLTWGIDSARAWELRGIAWAIVGVLLVVLVAELRRPLGDVLKDRER